MAVVVVLESFQNDNAKVRWSPEERTSRGLLVEHLASHGPKLEEHLGSIGR